MIKRSYTKMTFSLIVFILLFDTGFANYDSQIKQVDQLVEKNMKTIKSSEKLDIPEYKGDTLTFQRLSEIRNVFNIDHLLPFEKRRVRTVKKKAKETVKLKPIIVPKDLEKVIDKKKTRLQEYPLDSFTFKGLVKQSSNNWGVVENSLEPKPIYLKEGELIGQNYGQISGVTKEGILVNEWMKDEKQRVWKKTQAVIR